MSKVKLVNNNITFGEIVKKFGNEPFYVEEAYRFGDGWVKVKDVCFEFFIRELINKGFKGFKLHVVDKNNNLRTPIYLASELSLI